jgi:para-aminobenzoate synthetase/4-amino-4-deoxychorismate lyase
LTEGTISNLFLERRGKLYTPPLYSGLLPGTLRQNLLDEGRCQERVLHLDDLRQADKVFLGNSVRALLEAVCIDPTR